MRDWEIIEAIQDAYEDEGVLAPDVLRVLGYQELVEAAIKSFGKWETALIACDLESEVERLKKQKTSESIQKLKTNKSRPGSRWDKELVIGELQMIHQRFGTVSWSTIKYGRRGLEYACKRYFGSVSDAVIAAGLIPPERIRRVG